jgi:pentapeptide repeat protein
MMTHYRLIIRLAVTSEILGVGLLILFIALGGTSIPPQAGQSRTAPDKCPNPSNYRPSKVELVQIIKAHAQWLVQHVNHPAAPGRAVLCNADLNGADLRHIDLSGADLRKADLRSADLSETSLIGVDLNEADLTWALLIKTALPAANLHKADLTEADLTSANLRGARLNGTLFIGADLSEANLIEAHITATDLTRADLTDADLSRAHLNAPILTDSKFFNVNLSGTQFQPKDVPDKGAISGLSGLLTVRFEKDQESGLVLLRTALRDAGLRDLERQATYVIEHWRTKYQLQDWRSHPGTAVGAALRFVFFEWTTGYGLYPGWALMIIMIVTATMIEAYWAAICSGGVSSGIFRISARETLVNSPQKVVLSADTSVESLPTSGWPAFGYALYFSLLSAFHIGWRDLNVGTWIARMQPREFSLRANGWVRVVSGLQSLLSVYLLAIWALTYFGRPFE